MIGYQCSNIGVTREFFQHFGKTPSIKSLLNISVKIFNISGAVFLSIVTDIPGILLRYELHYNSESPKNFHIPVKIKTSQPSSIPQHPNSSIMLQSIEHLQWSLCALFDCPSSYHIIQIIIYLRQQKWEHSNFGIQVLLGSSPIWETWIDYLLQTQSCSGVSALCHETVSYTQQPNILCILSFSFSSFYSVLFGKHSPYWNEIDFQ